MEVACSPKYQFTFNTLQGSTSQKTELFKRALLQYWAMWKIIGKTVEQSFKQCYIRNALDGTAGILQGNSDLNCPDLNSNLGESVNLERETRCAIEEDSVNS
jgi:hypothetical protein